MGTAAGAFGVEASREGGEGTRRTERTAGVDDDRERDTTGKDLGYVKSKAKQDEFEELAREEGFDQAAKDAAKGKKPKKEPPTSSSA